MKHLIGLFVLALGLVWGLGQILPGSVGYASVLKHVGVQPAIQAQAVDVAPSYPRTIKTVRWTETICSNEATKADYTMHLVSREEIIVASQRAGFQGQALSIAVALAYAEGQADLTCQGDWDLANDKWQGSVGLWQIRTLRVEQGKGTCRDLDALNKGDIDFQARCAYQVSGKGTNWQPWSAFTNRKYLKYLT